MQISSKHTYIFIHIKEISSKTSFLCTMFFFRYVFKNKTFESPTNHISGYDNSTRAERFHFLHLVIFSGEIDFLQADRGFKLCVFLRAGPRLKKPCCFRDEENAGCIFISHFNGLGIIFCRNLHKLRFFMNKCQSYFKATANTMWMEEM